MLYHNTLLSLLRVLDGLASYSLIYICILPNSLYQVFICNCSSKTQTTKGAKTSVDQWWCTNSPSSSTWDFYCAHLYACMLQTLSKLWISKVSENNFMERVLVLYWVTHTRTHMHAHTLSQNNPFYTSFISSKYQLFYQLMVDITVNQISAQKYEIHTYLSSQSFCDSRNDYLSLYLSVCLSCY